MEIIWGGDWFWFGVGKFSGFWFGWFVGVLGLVCLVLVAREAPPAQTSAPVSRTKRAQGQVSGVSCATERDTDTGVGRGGCFVTISDTSALVWSAMGGLEVGGLGCLTTWARPGGQDFGVAGRLRMTYDLRGKGPHDPRPAWPPWRLEDKMTETNSSTSRTSLPRTFSLPVNAPTMRYAHAAGEWCKPPVWAKS